MKNIFSFGSFMAYQIRPYLDGLNPTQSLKAKKKEQDPFSNLQKISKGFFA
jgi:hypothetical protein